MVCIFGRCFLGMVSISRVTFYIKYFRIITMDIIRIFFLLFLASHVQASTVFIEAESFSDKGGWVVDQQFMDLMGSSYLMAHGMGTPVKDASTEIDIPVKGTYFIYIRTFNWTSPWCQGKGPGKFQIIVNGKRLPSILGAKGQRWIWQDAGKINLPQGKTIITLTDLTGFNGRCDAIYLTTEKEDVPPSDLKSLNDFRRKKTEYDIFPTERSSYDLVVVGGGIAGMCAAVTASRLGCKVALINDRPILGGNNSSEVRVHLGGHIEVGPNKGLGRIIREFGHSRWGNAQPKEYYEDTKKEKLIASENNITLFANYRAISVEMEKSRIKSIVIKHIETGKELCLESSLFSDCTGDATIGYLAGADYRIGREARSEFKEQLAPLTADRMTMGASVQWYSKDVKEKTSFPQFNYGIDFNESNCEKVIKGEWTWETGMNLDPINDAERIRDYGLLVVYSNWSFLKNHLKDNNKYRNRELEWVAYIAGKRESRRLLGDYILKQDDIDKNVFHEDASFTTTWSLDLHFPDPENSKKFPGAEFKASTKHIFIHPYAVPYRCLYSRNVENLFMAGRNISVTHVALGTVRVMRTTGMMGEVVGIAASLCKKYRDTPRGIYQHHLGELKEWMQKGVGKTKNLPDNQKFNCAAKLLPEPEVCRCAKP